MSVSVAVGATILTATSDSQGDWSVSVPPNASYITGASVSVTVSASKTGFTSPTDVERTLAIDLDDEASTAVALSLDPDRVAERGGARSVTATAALDGAARAAPTAVTVSWTTAGTATAGVDYQSRSAFTVTIPANQTSGTATFTFTPLDDTDEEGDETVVLRASATGLTDGAATLTIDDNDGESEAVLLSVSPSSVSESGGARSVRVTATLDQSARTVPTDVVVSLHSLDVEFGPGRDAAVVAPFTITIEPGRASASGRFTLLPHDDALAEGTESIEVRGEATGLRVEPATLELTDDDTATVNLAVPYVSRHSEGGGAMHVTVEATLGAARSTDTVVTVQVRGSGRSGVVGFAAVDDFELTIPAGARRNAEGGFMLYPQNDDVAEADETLTISGRAAGLRVTGTTFLLEDDDSETASTTVTLELNETRLAESGGAHVDLTVTGTLDGAPRERDTVVTLTPTNRKGDGSEVSALVDAGMRLTIRAGRISGRRTFGIVLNTPGIDQEDGVLTLGGTADGLTVEPATLELLDGDAPPGPDHADAERDARAGGLARNGLGACGDDAQRAHRGHGRDADGDGHGRHGRGELRAGGGFQADDPEGVGGVRGEVRPADRGRRRVRPQRDADGERGDGVSGLRVLPATLTLVDGDAPQAVSFAFFANGGSIASRNGGLIASADAGVITSANVGAIASANGASSPPPTGPPSPPSSCS